MLQIICTFGFKLAMIHEFVIEMHPSIKILMGIKGLLEPIPATMGEKWHDQVTSSS